MKDVVTDKDITYIDMFKNFIQYLFVGFVSALAPIKPISLTLTFLIFTDFVFGIHRAIKLKEEITSRKMAKSIGKILLYNMVIVLLYYTNIYIFNTGLELEKMAATLICLVELKSIDESWKLIYGWSLWGKLSDAIDTSINRAKIKK